MVVVMDLSEKVNITSAVSVIPIWTPYGRCSRQERIRLLSRVKARWCPSNNSQGQPGRKCKLQLGVYRLPRCRSEPLFVGRWFFSKLGILLGKIFKSLRIFANHHGIESAGIHLYLWGKRDPNGGFDYYQNAKGRIKSGLEVGCKSRYD